jgi:hypothetical protein
VFSQRVMRKKIPQTGPAYAYELGKNR